MVKRLDVILNLFQNLDPDIRQDDIKNNQSGFSTVEILVAVSILVVVFSAVILLVLGSQTMATDTQTAHEAQLLNDKIIEDARAATLADFNSDASTVLGTNPDGIYTKAISQSYVSPCVKSITAKVTWSREGRSQYVTTTTQVTNPSVVFAMGTECNVGIPPGDNWQNCFVYGSASLSGPDQDAYDLDVTRINGTKYVFEVTHPKNGHQAAEDLWVYNVNNEASPQLVSDLDTNGSNNVGINSIIVASVNGSKYAYLGNDTNSNHLVIIDVSDPAHLGTPVLYNIPGEGSNKVSDLDIFNGKLYVAIGSDIKVYTLTSPTAPVLQTTYTLGGTVNKIAFNSANNLFAAVSDSAGELVKVVLSSGTITKFNISGNQAGSSVSVLGTRIYLGTSSGVNENNFYIVDDTSSGLTLMSSNNLPHQNNKRVLDNIVLGKYLFALVEAANQEFQVYDISDINNFAAKCTNHFNPTNIGTGFDYFEGYVYSAMEDNNELQIFSDHN